MSSREPTLADVAELAGVSLTTVSRVLNNRGYLSEKTKKNVADAIETLGYRPNSLARALHGKRTQTVGLIVPAVSLPFFGELAVEVENALADARYRILICNSMGRADREREYLSLLVGNRVDGIISGAHNEGLGEYDTIRMPLVTIDRELSPSIPNVRCANEEAGAMATRALIEGGCRHPLLLTSRSGSAQSARGRLPYRGRARGSDAARGHRSLRYADATAFRDGSRCPGPGSRHCPRRRGVRDRRSGGRRGPRVGAHAQPVGAH